MLSRKKARTTKSGNNATIAWRMHHIKKPDGEPLWRADIQYDLLHHLFTNDRAVFTDKATGARTMTFADLYIQTMADSPKCSKVLSEKLLKERDAGMAVAMICFLVNIGRMNTTINFFPEMKAQLRTYHPVPSLQAGDTSDNKQLQDAPRLKSILKGACEHETAISELSELSTHDIPTTNPIKLIFLMSTDFTVIEKQFMSEDASFADLIMNPALSSASRAQALLWLFWAYLETDQSQDQVASNPFGSGHCSIPPLVPLTDDMMALENVDPLVEISFGNKMAFQRHEYLKQTTTNATNASAQPLTGKRTRQASSASSRKGTTKPNVLVVPEGRTPSKQQELKEFRQLLNGKRERRKSRRMSTQDSLQRELSFLSELDPVFDSDEDFVAHADVSDTSPSLIAAGLGDQVGDFGESCSSIVSALKAACSILKSSQKPAGEVQ